jgi:hypothetical protein
MHGTLTNNRFSTVSSHWHQLDVASCGSIEVLAPISPSASPVISKRWPGFCARATNHNPLDLTDMLSGEFDAAFAQEPVPNGRNLIASEMQ